MPKNHFKTALIDAQHKLLKNFFHKYICINILLTYKNNKVVKDYVKNVPIFLPHGETERIY